MFISLFALHILSILVYFTGANALRCAYLKLESSTEDPTAPSIISAESVQHCTQESSFCFALWHHDPYDPFNTARYRLRAAGCWNNTQDKQFCSQSQCISQSKPQRALNDTKFCCCHGDVCNLNVSIGLSDALQAIDGEPNLELDSVNVVEDIARHPRFACALLALFVLTVILVCALCYKSIYSTSKIILNHEKAMDSFHLLESQSLSLPSPTPHFPSICSNICEDLSLLEIIGSGKYGTVWRGQLAGATVAVKIVAEENKRFLLNECRIYSLPLMTHPGLPRFHGYQERLVEGRYVECCMALEYGHLGSLHSYLQQHTLDWSRLCKLAKSLAQGLAYLHTELGKGDQLKPSIAHRDLCSRNVIVKADGTSMICDFQFAVCFLNNKALFYEDRCASSALVGSLRYMAPELLEGAINLNHCESALKQADIYSLGLILWEMASRCSDLYQGIDVPSYKMPFEQEAGPHATFDQLRVLVSRHKARPLFPDIWKDSNPAIRLLKETIAECWDQEPEARLTALCIKERLCELPLLWKRYKSETLANCCVVSSLQQLKSMQSTLNGGPVSGQACGNSACKHEKISALSDSLEPKYASSNCYINKFENSLHYKYNNHHHLLHHPYHKHHFYQLNLANSKKHDLNSNLEKNINAAGAANNINTSPGGPRSPPKLTLPLQPHQARNLCIERNLMSDTSDEQDGLLEQGLKFQSKSYLKSNINAPAAGIADLSESSEPSSDGHSSVTGASHPHFTESRTLIRPSLPLPISYVQNETSNQPTKAKETNKYQNRHESGQLLPKISLFEYIKQKFNLAHLSKSSRDKASSKQQQQQRAKQSIGPLLEEWKENCEESIEIAAARLGSLLYSKEAGSLGLEYSGPGANNLNIATIANSSGSGASGSHLSINSSPLISAECDLSLLHQSDLLSKDKLAYPTNNQPNKSSCNQTNNRIDSLGLYLAGNSKMELRQAALQQHRAAGGGGPNKLVREESQLLQAHVP